MNFTKYLLIIHQISILISVYLESRFFLLKFDRNFRNSNGGPKRGFKLYSNKIIYLFLLP